MLKAVRYRVQNFRNIDDSDWIPLECVTAFVGRNESGKTALLRALHKFNPATPEPYNAQREFPRDRFNREFKNPADWPVCSVAFEIMEPLRSEIQTLLDGTAPPKEAIFTRYYDAHVTIHFEPAITEKTVAPAPVVEALKLLAAAARRIPAPSPEEEEQTQKRRTDLAAWASAWQEKINAHTDLRTKNGVTLLSTLRNESNGYANPQTADRIETLHAAIDPVLSQAQKTPPANQATEMVRASLPVFIYFENYGILDSAVYLPRFLEDLKRTPDEPHIRTI